MLYRVRIDMSFEDEAHAKALFNHTKGQIDKAVNINEGLDNEEKSYCEIHDCGHDDGSPCINWEKIEVE